MDGVPAYVSIVFILTTFLTVGFLLQAVKAAGLQTLPVKILLFLLPLWILLTGILSVGGFYLRTDAMPPRMLIAGVLPTLLVIAAYFIFFRKTFVERLPLRLLTLLHVVRIPVELVLYWLFVAGAVPQVMTFEGRNFDIATGILAVILYFAAFRGNGPKRWLLVAFNFLGLLLLANIVSIAVMSLPTPLQLMSFDQPNIAVLYFPYVWLPTIIVPIVLFSHLAALWQLLKRKQPPPETRLVVD
jgi:hypothetical protein